MTGPITTPEQMREAAVLLPCPFCGGQAGILIETGVDYADCTVACHDCSAETFARAPSQDKTDSAWNAAVAGWNFCAIPVAPQSVAVTVKPLPHGAEKLDAALAEYTPGIDHAVRFITIDQVDALAEFYLQNRNATHARDVRAAALREAGKALRDWQDDLNANSLPETAITVGSAADLILALIDKEPQP